MEVHHVVEVRPLPILNWMNPVHIILSFTPMCSEWSCVTFCNILFYMALRSDTPPNPQAGKTTPCQLSICAYSIFLKDAYHPYLEVFSSIYMSRKYHALVTRNLFNVADFVLPVCKI
jgi:hypothetical protein